MEIVMSIVVGNPRTTGETRTFLDGSTRAHTLLKTAAVGYGTYEPGWRWSTHAGPQTGKRADNHIGYILSGTLMVRDPEGNEARIEAGDAFELGPGADAWVAGNVPCVALDFIPLAK
jgi:redox-sensitive bicupin YhaK (pirin superfamily)